MLSHDEYMAEYMALDGIVCSEDVSLPEALAAIERFKALDLSDEQRASGLDAVEGSMEWRSPGHMAGKR